jgi:hypothetical protein
MLPSTTRCRRGEAFERATWARLGPHEARCSPSRGSQEAKGSLGSRDTMCGWGRVYVHLLDHRADDHPRQRTPGVGTGRRVTDPSWVDSSLELELSWDVGASSGEIRSAGGPMQRPSFHGAFKRSRRWIAAVT